MISPALTMLVYIVYEPFSCKHALSSKFWLGVVLFRTGQAISYILSDIDDQSGVTKDDDDEDVVVNDIDNNDDDYNYYDDTESLTMMMMMTMIMTMNK